MGAAQRCIASSAALEVAYVLVGTVQDRQIDQRPQTKATRPIKTHQDPFAAARSPGRYTQCNATKRPSVSCPLPLTVARLGCLDFAIPGSGDKPASG